MNHAGGWTGGEWWVREWAKWFNEELHRRGASKPHIGLGCSPVLVSGTKKLFLKWIRTALRQKRIEVPDCNGPVRWTLAYRFFRAGMGDVEDDKGSRELLTISRADYASGPSRCLTSDRV